MPYIKKDYVFTLSDDTLTDVKYKTNTQSQETIKIFKNITDTFISQIQDIITGTPFEELITWDAVARTFKLWNFEFLVECAPVRCYGDRTYENHSGGYVYTVPYIKVFGQKSHYNSIVEYHGYNTTPSANGENDTSYHAHKTKLNADAFTGGVGIAPLEYSYSLILLYNTNIFSLYYISNNEIHVPIINLVKGRTWDNRDVVYMCFDLNSTKAQPDYNTCNYGYHMIKFCDYPYDTDFTKTLPYMTDGLSYNGNNCRNPFGNNGTANLVNTNNIGGLFTKIADTRFLNKTERKLLDIDFDSIGANVVLLPIICFGGLITFDNLYTTQDTVPKNSVLSIDGEQFYCPKHTFAHNIHTQHVLNTMIYKL